ncbi:hypothetical protein [Frankia sp. AiPa1]|uniref:hypothetical protein n=1 Tax=Frankia sp. AiPa1 TaxID=573492 RepID=UPI00202AEBE5|nr:hypothetical protein [Frankia sp. AiPa1]MCL9762303.1 hypothetical protein [Frankia sp. AiPa1]
MAGTVTAALALGAFFGIQNFTQLKALLTPGSSTGGAPTSATASCSHFSPYCNRVHFVVSGTQFAGRCSDLSGCPVSGTFTNMGTRAGQASVIFTLNRDENSGGERVGSCSAPIPVAIENGVVTAGCTIYPLASSGRITLTALIDNPIY